MIYFRRYYIIYNAESQPIWKIKQKQSKNKAKKYKKGQAMMPVLKLSRDVEAPSPTNSAVEFSERRSMSFAFSLSLASARQLPPGRSHIVGDGASTSHFRQSIQNFICLCPGFLGSSPTIRWSLPSL